MLELAILSKIVQAAIATSFSLARISMATLGFLILFFVLVITGNLWSAEAKSLTDLHKLLTADEVEKIFGTVTEDVPEYDVMHPVQTDHRGRFLSYDVSYSNSNKVKKNLFFRISAFSYVFPLNVSINTEELFSPDFVTEVRNNGKSQLSTSPLRCHYVGHVVSPEGLRAKVAISNCDGLTGMIRTKREILMVSPLPKRLNINENTKRAHVVYRMSNRHAETMIRKLGVNTRSDTWCGVKAPGETSKKDTVIPEKQDREVVSDVSKRDKRYTIEAVVVADKKMTQFHGVDQIKIYIPTLINMVHSLLADSSIGVNIKYVLNKLQILETDEPGLVINSHASKTLSRFCRWMSKENRGDDTNPAHFDHATLISRLSFCSNTVDVTSPRCNSLLGLADLAGMCGTDTSCTLNTDTGLGTAFTIAHETGHNLGAEHDSEGNRCPNGVNIMATKASGKATAFEWSACSSKYITKFLSGYTSGCLNDRPGRSVPLPKALAGQEYSLDDQCRRMVKGSSGACKMADKTGSITCYQLWCTVGDSCTTINEPAAEGSSCGKRKWCRRGVCVRIGKEGPKAVDGGYSKWSPWGKCSHPCGGGVRTRTRQCNNPTPRNGGKLCVGESKKFQYCNNQKCSSNVPDTRMIQCKSKRNQKFEYGVKYNWVYNPKAPVPKKKRCSLFCEAPMDFNEVMFYDFGKVKDGTKCNGDGPDGVCIAGVCKVVGCDNVLGSTAKKDRCGVCKGDGTSCKDKTINTITRKIYDQYPDPYGAYYQTITTIPVGARDIEIKELKRSSNVLSLITLNDEPITDEYFKSNKKYKYHEAGTTFEVIKKNAKEMITAKGPLTKAVILEYYVENWDSKYKVSYKYSMTSSTPSRAVSSDTTTHYKWMTKTHGCSAECGGGKMLLLVSCVREDNGSPVSHELCSAKEIPDIEQASVDCNTRPCKPSWNKGEWGDCSKTCNDGSPGQQQREVTCVRKTKGLEELLEDSKCEGPKPAMVRMCGEMECPAEWVTVKSGPCSSLCGKGIQALEVVCKKTGTNGRIVRVPDEKCPKDNKPPTTVTCHAVLSCEA
ncbi:A disintegrin and metalloproteinase with thrombospondin motifs 16-like [Actinia tenebrosa]|uniref:A disintegrin and metalloproteinase with thrombospondin motifs 16-like n=1 Tax=Actinia tenebrosa TaxID=6105 RepID=A0A6P8J221_ACTTE|nr:A disintegrin and metalloproteinase with thrombospondin motifs 16-like [Actinia tenebrosa]